MNGDGGSGSEPIRLDLFRPLKHKIPVKAAPRVLFLQGPAGPFFMRAQDKLNASGFDAWRVCFNAGDRLYTQRDKSLHFSGPSHLWKGWITSVLQENSFDFVVMFGCERELHNTALDQCEELGIRALCLEEGYLRPGYVTMEFGGNNSRSPIAGKLPPPGKVRRANVPKALPCPSSFASMATYAFVYFTVRGLLSTVSERKLFHKNKRALVSEGIYWVKNYYRKFANVGHNYRTIEHLLEHHEKEYFLVPLQVHDDSQLGRPAKSWNNQKLILKSIVSFARNAPPSAHLVFKIHPMERGHSRDAHFIKQLCKLNDVADRVHIIDGGSLGLLTRHSAGMITINSTSGLSAIFHGVPLAVFGKSIYRNPSLAYCIDKGIELDRFWTLGEVPTVVKGRQYIEWLAQETLVGGDFYAAEGIDLAVENLLGKLKQASVETPRNVNSGVVPLREPVRRRGQSTGTEA
ncbi:hypothetical protein MRS76_01640 [Rhizobiaceae bacterium n13]|uniref:Capsular biosynthesis protein n=1 Tax=Ferirhizobium litorale TaxID=2927786 RepID=A0AAE3QCP5_9HYPH|nr:hypothetical protein [Fererhizobium litorale]MDI7860646.1 hypothetical protein [Fererhizobium litorale]MDI7920794.1 hypothetical protein [Fererhizobium litorale]